MCAKCSITRPFGDPNLTNNPETVRAMKAFAARIGSPEPLRCCDDPIAWDWRAYLGERKRVNSSANAAPHS